MPVAFYLTRGQFVEYTDPDGNITVLRTSKDTNDVCDLLPAWGDA